MKCTHEAQKFCSCFNVFCFFAWCHRMVSIVSDDNYHIMLCICIVDIPRCKLCRGLNLDRPFMSGNVTCTMMQHVSSAFPIPTRTTYTAYLQKLKLSPILSVNIFRIHYHCSFHQLNVFLPWKHDLCQL